LDTAVTSPRDYRCRYCRARIRWALDMGGRWVALDAEPHPKGPIVIGRRGRTQGRALEIPPNSYAIWNDPDTPRWRRHTTTCGMGATGTVLSEGVKRYMRGDTRGSRRPTSPATPPLTEGARRPWRICDCCGAPILWGCGRDGQWIPLDQEPVRSGLLVFASDDPLDPTVDVVPLGELAELATTRARYRNHHLTCPSPTSDSAVKRSIEGWPP
jgi:hypothetical protein